MAETVLCWQSDPLYFNRNFAQQFIRPMPEVREAVAVALCRETSALFMVSPGERIVTDPPIQIAENVIALTRHVLGPDFEAPLRTSLKAVIRRLDALAPNPYQDFRGAFDFDSDADVPRVQEAQHGSTAADRGRGPEPRGITPADLAPLYADFIASVDWAANPYLRSPEELRQAGFVGKPYRHS